MLTTKLLTIALLGLLLSAPAVSADIVDLFDPNHVLEIEVIIDQTDWDTLRNEARKLTDVFGGNCTAGPPANPFNFYRGDVKVDGTTLTDVGIRKKGFIGSLDPIRPSLKIDFGEFGNDQMLGGLDRLTLNNGRQDASRIKQCLGYKLFAAAGVPTPRCSFAHVRVTTQDGTKDLGIYANIESIKPPFLDRAFGNSGGNLYEGQFGADFRPRWLASIEYKNNENSNDGSDIRALAEVLGKASDADLADAVGAHVNLDAYFTFWAAEGLIGHWDGYAGNTNNYYLYHNASDDRLSFIPWGADDILGQGNPLQGEGAVSPLVWARGKLARRLYLNPSTQARYTQRLQQLFDTIWDEAALLAEVDRVDALVAPFAGDRSQFVEPIREFIRTRRQKFAADFGTGAPAWTEPQSDRFCLSEVGQITAEFNTPWYATLPMLPTLPSQSSLTGNIYGIDLTTAAFQFVVVGGSDIATFAGRGLVRAIFSMGSLGLFVTQISLPPEQIVPGTVPVDGDLANVLVRVDNNRPTLLGSLSEGSIEFDQGTSATVGGRIIGRFSATLTQFTPAPGSCVGDCGADQSVTVDELVTAVNVALGTSEIDQCFSVDANEDFVVTVDELVKAVNSATVGCPTFQVVIPIP